MARKPTEKAVIVPPGARSDSGEQESASGPILENVSPLNPHALPMFSQLGRKGPHPTELRILRTDPSYARAELETTPDVSLDWQGIQQKYGGGTYRVECLDDMGRIIPGGVSTRKIPGEPKDSEAPGGGSLLALSSQKLQKGLFSVMNAERDFNERLITRQQADADLRIKIAKEEAAAKVLELEAKARIEREREQERRRAERDEERERHERELERERRAHDARMEELRLQTERQEKALEREREREREAAAERVQASERLMSVVLGTVQSQTQTMIAAMQSSKSDVGAMLGMFQNGMQLMQQVGAANQPSEGAQTLTMLGNVAEKTIAAFETKSKVEALAEVRKGKLAAGQAPAGALPSGARSNPAPPQAHTSGKAKVAEPSKPAPGHEQAPKTIEETQDKAAAIEAKARRVFELCIEKGWDPEELLDDVTAQLKGEMTPEEVLAKGGELEEDEEPEETPEHGAGAAELGESGRRHAAGTEADTLGERGPGDGEPSASRRDRRRGTKAAPERPT